MARTTGTAVVTIDAVTVDAATSSSSEDMTKSASESKHIVEEAIKVVAANKRCPTSLERLCEHIQFSNFSSKLVSAIMVRNLTVL